MSCIFNFKPFCGKSVDKRVKGLTEKGVFPDR